MTEGINPLDAIKIVTDITFQGFLIFAVLKLWNALKDSWKYTYDVFEAHRVALDALHTRQHETTQNAHRAHVDELRNLLRAEIEENKIERLTFNQRLADTIKIPDITPKKHQT